MERREVSLFLLLAALGWIVGASDAHRIHKVGGSFGWSYPPYPTFYQEWAASRQFAVGDKLLFEFTSGVETVVEVSAEDFNKCSNDEVIDMMYEGPAVVNLNTAGWRYFYSDVGLCCEAGQKLAVNVIKPRQPHKAYDSHPPPGRGEAHASPPVSG